MVLLTDSVVLVRNEVETRGSIPGSIDRMDPRVSVELCTRMTDRGDADICKNGQVDIWGSFLDWKMLTCLAKIDSAR